MYTKQLIKKQTSSNSRYQKAPYKGFWKLTAEQGFLPGSYTRSVYLQQLARIKESLLWHVHNAVNLSHVREYNYQVIVTYRGFQFRYNPLRDYDSNYRFLRWTNIWITALRYEGKSDLHNETIPTEIKKWDTLSFLHTVLLKSIHFVLHLSICCSQFSIC